MFHKRVYSSPDHLFSSDLKLVEKEQNFNSKHFGECQCPLKMYRQTQNPTNIRAKTNRPTAFERNRRHL